MKIFENLFLRDKQKFHKKEVFSHNINEYGEIGKLVKEARIQKNISIEDLSRGSKIPEYIIDSIENNVENLRPKDPFIRSILFKLEECLTLKKYSLVGFLRKEKKNSRKNKEKFIIRKFDILNSWEGIFLYFLVLILTLFVLKRYFFLNVNIIEIKNIQEEIIKK